MTIWGKFVDRISGWFGTGTAGLRSRPATPTRGEAMRLKPRELFDILENYYLSNGLYDDATKAIFLEDTWIEGMKALRNPANRVVEFYAKKLWPGTLPDALPIVADNERILEAIQQIWTWGNWASQKQVCARRLALYGGEFIKVATRGRIIGFEAPGKPILEPVSVYQQLIPARHCTDFDMDERGILTRARIDQPLKKALKNQTSEIWTRTEIWDQGGMSIYEHRRGNDAPIEELGIPTQTTSLADIGIDFIPIVYAKFRDIGEQLGVGSFVHTLDKIDEACRMATRLHQMCFRYNKAIAAVTAGGNDPMGRPLPAPRIGGATGDGTTGDTLTLRDDTLFRLPGNSDLKFLVPDINYSAMLALVDAQMRELEADLPELVYYRVNEASNRSGRAMQFMLTAAIDNCLEARGNAEAALVRADSMGLTLAQVAKLPGFSPGEIGTYDAGDFTHQFKAREVITTDDLEQAQAEQAKIATLVAKRDIGASNKVLLAEAGYAEDEIDEILQQRAAEDKASANLGSELLRRFEQGEGGE